MKNDILTKLAMEMQENIILERQVVYILVEMRKLIELNEDGDRFRTLKFCCDWVAHPTLQGLMAQEIVRQFDKYQEFLEAQTDAKPVEQLAVDANFLTEFKDVLRMSTFRNELGAYLRSQGLDSTITDDAKTWTNFLTYYTSVIQDCPLKCVSQGLKFTDEVVLRVFDVRPNAEEIGSEYCLAIEWSWVSKTTGMENKNIQYY